MGSKILVTTRMDSVALMIAYVINKKEEILRLEGLKEDECLQLLDKYAFAKVENPYVHHNLRSITQKIVKKLSGSPLAARVTGGVLNSHLDERHWKRVLDYDIGSQNDIFSVLKLSYIFLPQVLQNCFSYCSIFPQDYEFDKDDLIRMWIALDFIQPHGTQEETLTEAGERYFDNLVGKFLFDKFQFHDRTYYKLHDLLHDMIRSISAQECFSVVDDEVVLSKIPKTIRHLFVQVNDPHKLKKMGEFKNLRSLYLSGLSGYNFDDVLINILKTSSNIRLLYLDCPFTIRLPEEVGHLIHLRYLKFAKSKRTLMPTSLSNLYHLKFMSWNETSFEYRDFFPSGMNNLRKLHYLKLPFPGMQGIGKLNSLQELNGLYIQNKEGYRIGELEYMNELRQLKIEFYDIVNVVEDACKAKLYDKRNLTNLSLALGPPICPGWTKRPHSTVSEKVLDNLQPHNSLKRLELDAYYGARSALWMNNIDLISNLEYIKLESCGWWQTLPPFGQLPLLKFLYLNEMPETKRFDYSFHGNAKHCVFPSLQVLYIDKLEELKDWFDARAATENCLFPCLTEMCLFNCSKLQQLPSLPPKLDKLDIYRIGWKGLNWLQGTGNNCSISIKNLPDVISLRGMREVQPTGNCELILSELDIKDPSILLTVKLRSISSIKKLTVKANDELVLFPDKVEQWFLQVSPPLCELILKNHPRLRLLPNMPASLEKLELKQLDSLQSVPSSVESLPSLKVLSVVEVPQLQLLPNIPASLEQLELEKLDSLQSLPSSVESLPSLKVLRVVRVPQLQLLTNIPASLEKLELEKLDSLQSLPSSVKSLPSLKVLSVVEVPRLQLLPNIPASLEQLELKKLDSLQSLPSSMESLPLLKVLSVVEVPRLQLLPNIPASLEKLKLAKLESLRCVPSFLSIFSLKHLDLSSIPLQKLPALPPSLCELYLGKLDYLDCLPSYLHSLSSLQKLYINDAPLLRDLPDLPPSLKTLILGRCHPELEERYKEITASHHHKIAHIPHVLIE